MYSFNKLSDFDRKNVEMLNLFYSGIDKYARKNYIYPLLCDFGNFYKVKLNNFGFDVGMLVGQGTVFFFNKTAMENEDEFIDFNDVMVDKKQANVDQINATLDTLSNMVITFYESGVPIDAIVNTIDNTLKDITSKNVKKTRKLIK